MLISRYFSFPGGSSFARSTVTPDPFIVLPSVAWTTISSDASINTQFDPSAATQPTTALTVIAAVAGAAGAAAPPLWARTSTAETPQAIIDIVDSTRPASFIVRGRSALRCGWHTAHAREPGIAEVDVFVAVDRDARPIPESGRRREERRARHPHDLAFEREGWRLPMEGEVAAEITGDPPGTQH